METVLNTYHFITCSVYLHIDIGNNCLYKLANKKIRSDNGKKYINDTFDKFCEKASIEHQLTTPYTPQQNGVSERKNWTIMEMTRCMLYEKEMRKKLWAEAANTTVFFVE